MSEITFKASITKVDGKAPPQHGVPTASVHLAGYLDDQVVAQLYSWADGDVVHVTIWREEEHEQLTFDSTPQTAMLDRAVCSECDGLGFDHAEDCTKRAMETAAAAEAFLKE